MSSAPRRTPRHDQVDNKIAELEGRLNELATQDYAASIDARVGDLELQVSGKSESGAADRAAFARLKKRVWRLKAQILPHEPPWRDLIKAAEHMSTSALQEYLKALLILAKRDP